MVYPQLVGYITEQLRLGITKDIIVNRLLETGWKQDDIDMAYSQVTRPFPMPQSNQSLETQSVPEISNTNKKYLRPLVLIVVLLAVTVGGVFGWQYLNKNESDVSDGQTISDSGNQPEMDIKREPVGNNNLVVYTKSEGDSQNIYFYDILSKSTINPNNEIICDGRCSLSLTEWSPDGEKIGVVVFDRIDDFDHQEIELYLYNQSENKFTQVFFEAREGENHSQTAGEILLFGVSFWKNDYVLQTTSGLIIDFSNPENVEIKDAGDVGLPVLGGGKTLVNKRADYIHSNIIFTSRSEDTGVEKFQGFFAPNTVYETTYQVTVDNNLPVDLDYRPMGVWNDYVVTFQPSEVEDFLTVVARFGPEGINEDELSEEEITEIVNQALGPKSDAKIVLRPLSNLEERKVILIKNDSKWINASIRPIVNTNKILIYQATNIQTALGESRIMVLSLDNPDQLNLLTNIPSSGIEFLAGIPISPTKMSPDGKYVAYTQSSTVINEPPDDLSGLQKFSVNLLSTDLGELSMICKDECIEVKIYDPFDLYRVDFWHE